jgi:hypothetical protein
VDAEDNGKGGSRLIVKSFPGSVVRFEDIPEQPFKLIPASSILEVAAAAWTKELVLTGYTTI